MALRYGDADIARVLNTLGRRMGKGKPWSYVAVKTARRNHAIEGRATLADPELLTLQAAARYTATSDTIIKKLVDAGVLRRWCPLLHGSFAARISRPSKSEGSSIAEVMMPGRRNRTSAPP